MTAVTTAPTEAFRPALHYSARNTWLNDPNGLVYHRGLYHLFYQHNPHGNVWGNMSWGHASSPDLTTWTEQPVAIACDDNEDIFSGSIVADPGNTSGFGSAENPPLVAIYTSAFKETSAHAGLQAQSLAYSLDEGLTWTKHEGNPVLDRQSPDFRDPKVFRYDGPRESYWVMVAVEATDHLAVLYRSTDLKAWTYLSAFGPANATGGVWECPDLFTLPLDGDLGTPKWVLIVNLNPGGVSGGSGGQYFVGDFDGTTFISETTVTPEASPRDHLREYNWLDWGRDYYAAVSFSGVPDGKRIMIAWMNNWDYGNHIPTSPWRSAMTLPREVRLETVHGEPRLLQVPVLPLASDASPVAYSLRHKDVTSAVELLPAAAWGQVLRIDVELFPGSAEEIGLIVRAGGAEGTRIGYDRASRCLRIDRTRSGQVDFHPSFASVESAPVDLVNGIVRLAVYVDRSSVEVFAQDGLVTMTDQVFPDPASIQVALYATGGAGSIRSLTIRKLTGP